MSDNSEFSCGQRVEDVRSGDRGTLEFVGSVAGSEGIWLGVDWDNPSRGKHNGCHNGTQYFKTRFESSGSFVRAGKITTGVDLETAVREKYQTPPPDSAPVENMLQHALKARFVQFVGMEKVSKKLGDLQSLYLVELKNCRVSSAGTTSLSALLPRVHELSLCGNLLSSWSSVADIVKQLPSLRTLNLSENKLGPVDSPSLSGVFDKIHHVILNNMLGYGWAQLMAALSLFPNINTLQLAYNELSELDAVPDGVMESVESLDIGANPISDWKQLLHLSKIPKLKELNVNNCQIRLVEFPFESEEQETEHSTSYFGNLQSLYIANNPLDNWLSVCQLAKLPKLEQLVLGFEIKADDYFPEFTYAIIRPLKMLNRTPVTWAEKKDYDLFYLKKFSKDYFLAGGTVDPFKADLTKDFREKHPTYIKIAKELGELYDDSKEVSKSSSRLRDVKLTLQVKGSDGRQTEVTVMPSVKISRLKMTLKRALKLPGNAKVTLSYIPLTRSSDIEIALDSDHRDLAHFSVSSGDELLVAW